MSKCRQLILQLRSSDNKKVLQAADELRKYGWLGDGTLCGIVLRHVHLKSADLSNASLQRVNLSMADMRWTDLHGADLQDAQLNNTNLYRANMVDVNLDRANLIRANLQSVRHLNENELMRANSMFGATMPDGSRYDGRYNLVGDLANARFASLDPNNPVEMAGFYGVSLSEYQAGQAWMRVHPTQPWFEISSADNQADVDAVVQKFFALERPGVLPG